MDGWESFDDLMTSAEKRCTVARFIAELPEEGQVAVTRSLDRDDSIPALRDAIRAIRPGHGIPSEISWYRHRRGTCGCSR